MTEQTLLANGTLPNASFVRFNDDLRSHAASTKQYHTTLSVADQPGITYDPKLRLFRLRCKDSLYAFRVDDARNLEHLYWGPPLPAGDDITYLMRAHVAMTFDPKGTVSIADQLGLEELNDIGNEQELSDKWKVYTRQRNSDDVQDALRSRRLENASWRLWHRERNRGGDLNIPQDSTLAEALQDPQNLNIDHDQQQSDIPSNHHPNVQSSPSRTQHRNNPHPSPSLIRQVSGGHNVRRMDTNPPNLAPNPTARLKRSLKSTRSVGNFQTMVELEAVPPSSSTRLTTSKISVSPLMTSRTSFEQRSSRSTASSPRISRGLSSQVFNPIPGSYGDLNLHDSSTNWGNLDAEVVGKNTKLLEFSDQGTGDYRDPSFNVMFSSDGSAVCPIDFKGYSIFPGKKPMPSPMPGMYTDNEEEATSLIVEMEDKLTGLKFFLHYTVYHDYDIITRRSVVVNTGKSPVTVKHLVSGTFDFDAESNFYMTQLAGGWARERDIITQKLDYGTTMVKSIRGASSHQFNPFIVISPEREPAEDQGECFGFALVYSGNFAAASEVTEYGRLRVNMGINPEGFTWYLDTEKYTNTFQTPEVVMCYSDQGMGKMSRTLHRAFRERLMPRNWRYKIPPVLINTWEAAYFDVNHEIVVEIAQAAVKADIELLVLDDGWFGQRNNTRSGLGDWTPNLEKFPFGIDGVTRAVNEVGLKFGIWIEPEMVSMNSNLYRSHPDWCLRVPARSITTGRNQLVLDFSRQIVRDHIYNQLYRLLASANIEYVKWDMNRHLTEVFSQGWDPTRQGEISHRFLLGVYEVLGRLTEAFPHVLFETCSGGGGRFDAGMLYFSPQIWTSDNTDALSRLSIQYGTSLAYPASAMGAHVSAVPNHQTLRSTPMKTRSIVAMSGTFGYELDPREFSDKDVDEVRGYIDVQKRIAPLVYRGDMYRLWSPFDSNSAAWMFVSEDKKEAVVTAVNIRRIVGRLLPRLKLKGLIPETLYKVEELCPGTLIRNADTGAIDNSPYDVYQYGDSLVISGRTLMHAGLPVKFLFDADSIIFSLVAEKNE